MKLTSEIRLENLNKLVEEAGGVTELSRLTGYKQPSYLYQIINRTPVQNGKAKNIGTAMAKKLELAMGKPDGWMDQRHKSVSESNSMYMNILVPLNNETLLDENDDVEVPFYQEICSLNGEFARNTRSINELKLRFSKLLLQKCGINPSNVVCTTADGDSMTPVIPDGALLGINKTDKIIKDGKIYAINHEGLVRTKILKKRPGNRILIQSYNSEEYPDEEVDMSDINVIGRIFWWSVFN